MKNIYIKTTETCNLDCPHCFTSGSQGAKVFWNIEKVKNWLAKLDRELPKDEMFVVALHGGEPFICKMEDLNSVADFVYSLDRETDLSASTNLVYKLTPDRLEFITKRLSGIMTSWDMVGRFQTEEQLKLWESNIKTIQDITKDPMFIKINTVLTKPFIHFGIDRYFNEVIFKNNIKYMDISKLTVHGSAKKNPAIVPTNKEVRDYFYQLHEYVEKHNLRKEIVIDVLEDIYIKIEKKQMDSGTYFRQCETNLYTINANGTVSSCPNEAPTAIFGTIDDSIEKLHNSPKRIFQIHQETVLPDTCYKCDLLDYCGGGCYKQHWDETGCTTPKRLIRELINKT